MIKEQNTQVSVDGKRYALDTLSPEARTLVGNLRAAEIEIASLQNRMLMAQTAHKVFSTALRKSLSKQAAAPAQA